MKTSNQTQAYRTDRRIDRPDGSGEEVVIHPIGCKVAHCLCEGKGGPIYIAWGPSVALPKKDKTQNVPSSIST